MDWKKIATWSLAVTAVGGTAWFGYKMYKAYKDIYGTIEEQELVMVVEDEPLTIQVQEALDMHRERDQIVPLQQYWGYDITALSDEASQHLIWVSRSEEEEDPIFFAKATEFNDKVVKDDIISAQEEEDRLELERLTIKDVEFEMLKYDVNSDQALEQFNEMLLADFDRGSDDWFVLRQMLDEPVLSDIPKDSITANNIIERRKAFFGHDSKWTNQWTWGEVIIYYGSRASNDLPRESYIDYVENWLIDLDVDLDYFESFISDLNNNELWYNGVYGLFSIDDDAIESHCLNYGFESRHVVPLETQYQIWVAQKLGI